MTGSGLWQKEREWGRAGAHRGSERRGEAARALNAVRGDLPAESA